MRTWLPAATLAVLFSNMAGAADASAALDSTQLQYDGDM
jgi:hypothetical protein